MARPLRRCSVIMDLVQVLILFIKLKERSASALEIGNVHPINRRRWTLGNESISQALTLDGFDAVSVQNVGSTCIIVSWDLPTHSNGILINFSLYCNGALAGVLPLTVISCNTTGLLPLTLYMYMSSSHARRHCTPVGTWCWASSVLQPACPVMYMYTSRNISGKITHTIYPPSLLPPFTITSSLSLAPPVHCDSNLLSMRRTALLGDPLILSQTLMTLSSVSLLIRSLTLTSPLAPRHKRFHTLFDLLKYGLMSKYNVMCSSLDPMEELQPLPHTPAGAGRGHGSFIPPTSPQTGNPGSITEIECTLLSGSAEQDALTMKESPLKNLILFFLRPHPSWGWLQND
ncbi:hypothetical protein EMCRGX_G030083 [Ephydatia muelleri]